MTTTARRLTVLLTTEGTYPYHRGGVSTWCHALTTKLCDVDFVLLAVAMHPYLERAYDLGPNLREIVSVPLWGTEDPAEYGWYSSAAEFLHARWETTSEVVARHFAPEYVQLLRELTRVRSSPPVLAGVVDRVHEYFQSFDYHRTMHDRAVWDAFAPVATEAWLRDDASRQAPSLGELVEAWRLLYRLMTVLAAPVPRTDLTHAAAAAFCGLPCVIAKRRSGTPFLLTEHGVYVREQYLNASRGIRSSFVVWFLLRVVSAVADLNYAFADQISPVCRYNTRWERWRGVDEQRIHVIYNGVDPRRFSPAEQRPASGRPLIVNVGLIFPLKGQLELIKAAALIRRDIPDVEVQLYGSASDRDYDAQCRALVRELGLENTVVFAGPTKEPWEVYRRADVVVMASISEAFPYSVIESMLTGAAIVATDVGGVREALGSTGVLVNPRDPAALARAVVALVGSSSDRQKFGQAARERALRYFTEDKFVAEYRESYHRLVEGSFAARTSDPPALEAASAGDHMPMPGA